MRCLRDNIVYVLCDIFISLFLICILQYIWKHICFAYHLTYKLTWNIIGGYIDPTPTDKPSHEHEPNPLHIASWHLSTSIYNQFTQSEVWSMLLLEIQFHYWMWKKHTQFEVLHQTPSSTYFWMGFSNTYLLLLVWASVTAAINELPSPVRL